MKKREFEHYFFGEWRVVFDNAPLSSEIQSQTAAPKEGGGGIPKLKQEVAVTQVTHDSVKGRNLLKNKRTLPSEFVRASDKISGEREVSPIFDQEVSDLIDTSVSQLPSSIKVSQESHFKYVLQKISTSHLSQGSSNFQITEKNLLTNVLNLGFSDNPNPQRYYKEDNMSSTHDLESMKNREVKELKNYESTIEGFLSQAWNGLFPSTPLEGRIPLNSFKWSKLGVSADYKKWDYATVENLITNVHSQQNFSDKNTILFFLETLHLHHTIHQLSNGLTSLNVHNQNDVNQYIQSVQSKIQGLNKEIKYLEKFIKNLEAVYPHKESRDINIDTQKEILAHKKTTLESFVGLEDFLLNFSIKGGLKSDKLGYDKTGKNPPSKEESFRVLKSIRETYVKAYEELTCSCWK